MEQYCVFLCGNSFVVLLYVRTLYNNERTLHKAVVQNIRTAYITETVTEGTKSIPRIMQNKKP
jgi:hypothetical protein